MDVILVSGRRTFCTSIVDIRSGHQDHVSPPSLLCSRSLSIRGRKSGAGRTSRRGNRCRRQPWGRRADASSSAMIDARLEIGKAICIVCVRSMKCTYDPDVILTCGPSSSSRSSVPVYVQPAAQSSSYPTLRVFSQTLKDDVLKAICTA